MIVSRGKFFKFWVAVSILSRAPIRHVEITIYLGGRNVQRRCSEQLYTRSYASAQNWTKEMG